MTTPRHPDFFFVGHPRSGSGLLDSYLAAIREARHSIRLYAPYFVPEPRFAAALVDARRRGVRVVILTNSAESLDESSLIFSAMLLSVTDSLGGRPPLVNAGVRMQIWSRRSTLHRKGGLIDAGHPGEKAFVGSDNLDTRGQHFSSESVVWTDDTRVVRQLARDFDRDVGMSWRLTRSYFQEWIRSENRTPAGRFRLWTARHLRRLF